MLSTSAAAKAVYIDFEGREKGPPTLLGILFPRTPTDEDYLEQHIFEHLFESAATARSLQSGRGHCVISTFEHTCEVLAELAHGDHPIIAWSSHESEVFEEFFPEGENLDQVLSALEDGKDVAKRWLRRCHPNMRFPRDRRRGTHRLDQYLKLIGYQIPTVHQAGQTGLRIMRLRRQLGNAEGDFELLTARQKGHWTKLLNHNRHDCFGLREVVLRATLELEFGCLPPADLVHLKMNEVL